MSQSTKPYKGARDFYPVDKRLQNYIFSVMQNVCESYGYEEYSAPILEPTDLFLMKGNQEIIDGQTYTFTDRGERSVTIRTEMTPSVSRMVAGKRQELTYPTRWYSIPNLWRYERTQRGRLREFWQLNVDIFGVDSLIADIEIIQVANSVMRRFGATPEMYTIKLNSRTLTDYIFEKYLELSKEKSTKLSRLIDRKAKMTISDFDDELRSILQNDQELIGKISSLLLAPSLDDLPDDIKSTKYFSELQDILSQLSKLGINNAVFDITLMRGFDYYSGIVFEIFDNDPENNRAMFGGGRYDGLVGMFGVQPVPTVGFGMGDVTLQNFLTSHHLLPKLPTTTDLYIVLVGNVSSDGTLGVASELRKQGINTALDQGERKLEKQIKNALSKEIPFIMFIGENELESNIFKVKQLDNGEEYSGDLSQISDFIKSRQKSIVGK